MVEGFQDLLHIVQALYSQQLFPLRKVLNIGHFQIVDKLTVDKLSWISLFLFDAQEVNPLFMYFRHSGDKNSVLSDLQTCQTHYPVRIVFYIMHSNSLSQYIYNQKGR